MPLYGKLAEQVQKEQDLAVEQVKINCVTQFGPTALNSSATQFYNETTKSFMCPAYFDQIVCWPYTPANTTAFVNCPKYFTGFIETEIATRTCLQNGTWFRKDQALWANYSACFANDTVTLYKDLARVEIPQELQVAIPIIQIISQAGYALSLISLVIAFLIMFLIKKLHCARNIVHMNLFASFILRAFIIILTNMIFNKGLGTDRDLIVKDGELYFHTDTKTNNYECKLLTSLVKYFTTANYSWILMEGLYLNNLIFRALFADSSRNLVYYIVLGWGLPLLVLVPWIVARIMVEDTFCWTTNNVNWIFLIIEIPTFASVLINLVLFVIISIVLYSKLRSPINEDSRRYQKWAKSTLVLVPLFGVHYAIFLIFYFVGETHIWIICDRFFGSFQGFFVAVLYCFMNGEVKTELKPYIYKALTFFATNQCFQYCFPCRQKYLRSAAARQSVCTTMSCSSLYTNGLMHRNSKPKCEMYTRPPKVSLTNEKPAKDHICYNNGTNKNSYSKSINEALNSLLNKTTINAETPLNNDFSKYDKNIADSATIEEEITMLSKQ